MRKKSDKHLDFIRSLPCTICPNGIETQAAHVRFADPRAAKPITGMGIKPDDAFTVPLCGRHHNEQHGGNEKHFWQRYGIDPIFVALALWRVSGDYEAGIKIVRTAQWERCSV